MFSAEPPYVPLLQQHPTEQWWHYERECPVSGKGLAKVYKFFPFSYQFWLIFLLLCTYIVGNLKILRCIYFHWNRKSCLWNIAFFRWQTWWKGSVARKPVACIGWRQNHPDQSDIRAKQSVGYHRECQYRHSRTWRWRSASPARRTVQLPNRIRRSIVWRLRRGLHQVWLSLFSAEVPPWFFISFGLFNLLWLSHHA